MHESYAMQILETKSNGHKEQSNETQEPRKPRKISVDLQESKPKAHNPLKGKLHDKPIWVCHFCGKSGHIRPNCFKLQAAK